jgi:hypothetical protein
MLRGFERLELRAAKVARSVLRGRDLWQHNPVTRQSYLKNECGFEIAFLY